MKTKKIWEKPQLTVLTRGSKDEHVLSGCKIGTGSPLTTSNASLFCWCSYAASGCAACDTYSTS